MVWPALVRSIASRLRSLVDESWLRRWPTGSEEERRPGERQTFELATRPTGLEALKSLACSIGESTILLIPRHVSGRHAAQDFWNVGYVLSIFARWPGQLAYKDQLPVVGPFSFTSAVCRLLGELSERAPHRFQEALTHLPIAVYDPSIGSGRIDGRADGRFSVDGADYDRSRSAFLHVTGHNVAGKVRNDWSEGAADEYARGVLGELGSRPRGPTSSDELDRDG